MGQVGRPRNTVPGCSFNHEMAAIADAKYHYECPTCGYVSPKFSSHEAAKEFQGYHPHPTVGFSKFTYGDGHEHVFRNDEKGKVTQPVIGAVPDERPTELPYHEIVRTHVVSKNPSPDRLGGKRLGAPQVASLLEHHYRNVMGFRQNRDLLEKYTSGEVQPKIDVRWNGGNPILTGGLTTLAMARKHFPDTPIGLNYID